MPREKVTPAQAIRLIHEGGGKAVFAHPVLCRFIDDRLIRAVKELKKAGLDGLEAMYSTYKPFKEYGKRNGEFKNPLFRVGENRRKLTEPYSPVTLLHSVAEKLSE